MLNFACQQHVSGQERISLAFLPGLGCESRNTVRKKPKEAAGRPTVDGGKGLRLCIPLMLIGVMEEKRDFGRFPPPTNLAGEVTTKVTGYQSAGSNPRTATSSRSPDTIGHPPKGGLLPREITLQLTIVTKCYMALAAVFLLS